MTLAGPALLCLCAGLLAGCAQFPEVDEAARERLDGTAEAPVILPIDGIRAEAATIAITPEGTAELQARAGELQARAAGMQGPVGDPEVVDRLIRALPAP